MTDTTKEIVEKNTVDIHGKDLVRVYDNYYLDRDGNCYTTLIPGTRGKRVGSALRKLRGSKGKAGYLTIAFGRGRTRYIHHLVLETFVGLRPAGMVACHRNDKRTDNRVVNLYWGTPKDNMEDARRNGGVERIRKAHIGLSPVNKTSEPIISEIVSLRRRGYRMIDVANLLGLSYVTVQKYCVENNIANIGLNRWRKGVTI